MPKLEDLYQRKKIVEARLDQIAARAAARWEILAVAVEMIDDQATCPAGHIMTDRNVEIRGCFIVCRDCAKA